MLKGLRENFRDGVDRLRWLAGIFSERFKVEVITVRLLYRREEMQKKKEELMTTVGRRVCELKSIADRDVFKDKTVIDALDEIEKTEKDLDEIRQRISEANGERT